MNHPKEQALVSVGPQGRVVIPARLRKVLAIERGDTLVAYTEDGRVILEKRDAALARVRGRFGGIPGEVSLADELVRERREEARLEREEAGG